MEHVRNMSGICMEYGWNMQRMCMEYVWHMYGMCMEHVWLICMDVYKHARRLPRVASMCAKHNVNIKCKPSRYADRAPIMSFQCV